MKVSDIKAGRSYADRHGNIFTVRDIHNGRAYFKVSGIHLLPLASSNIEGFADAMVQELKGHGD